MKTQLMPRVHPDLVFGKLASVNEPGFQQNLYQQIVEENPFLWNLIEQVLTSGEFSEEFQNGYCKAAAQFYDLLKSQMEIDDMESSEELESLNEDFT